MAGLYKCKKCGRYYSLSDEHENFITKMCNVRGIGEATVLCKCGNKRVAGGEADYDKDLGKFILCYSADYEEKFSHLRVFKAVTLKKVTKEEHHTAATVENGEIIYLAPCD